LEHSNSNYNPAQKKHFSVREIRRACNKELYRTIKKLKIRLTNDQIQQANELYFKKVLLNIQMISENRDNRKVLADWWEANVCPEISEIWNVETTALANAFRRAFGG
jgi:hypothetical protein